ncbi:sporulation integral membrane protein YtvI [Pseudoflavonifractor sp. 524-17]|uniref:sporulation integral membrane protein YtvI n=1 Tax=Pseudoflavonifractor sp. 524-17 TaxID=2304577 RepID=UPI00137A9D85|nr:sporulation integral membrane protein YtvI [Pseudoflavonifractor sp. 524-17]NCE65363.1 sporulation integral membrane protein YtvI [Pseudoflavonifractor sp. 524-17]
MPEKWFRTALRLLLLLALAAAGWLLLGVLLPCLFPLILALLFSAALEGPVSWLTRRTKLTRPWAAGVCTLIGVLLAAAGAGLLLWRLAAELLVLAEKLPLLLSALSPVLDRLQDRLDRLILAAPIPAQAPLRQGVHSLIGQAGGWLGQAVPWLGSRAAHWVSALPGVGLFLFTTALATFFTSADRPAVTAFLWRQAPGRWQDWLSQAGRALGEALLSWLRAQGLLILVTFLLLAAGFLLLRVELALLAAALTALLDALPVFGTGVVLLPWALIALIRGRSGLAVGLILLYGIAMLARSLLEPRLVGRHAGLPPLAALLAMYAGFAAFGTPGMILAPLAAVLLKELHARNLIRLWK